MSSSGNSTGRELVLAHLRSGNTLTHKECQQLFGRSRLAAIVLDLRHEGHNVVTEMISVTGFAGRVSRVAQYRLVTKAPASLFGDLAPVEARDP